MLAAQGWDAWPACSRKMGLRGHAAIARRHRRPEGEEGLGPREGHRSRSGGGYVVKRGDTLSKIAKARGTSVKALIAANGLKNAHVLKVGKSLKV